MPATLTGWVALSVILVIYRLAPVNATCSNCPFQWREFSGHCYLLVTAKMSFEAAEDNCRALSSKHGPQSHLASVSGPEENAFLTEYNSEVLGTGDMAIPWIGLNDRAQEGVFVWTDGSGYPYRAFAPTEPSPAWYNENCVVLWHVTYWNDIGCTMDLPSVCKMPSYGFPGSGTSRGKQ